MPRLVWKSEEDKASEWKFAKIQLKGQPSGTKLKRANNKKPIHYVTEDGEQIELSHSFVIVESKIFAIARGTENEPKLEQGLLGQGSFGRVKYAEDDEGKRYALKIIKQLSSLSNLNIVTEARTAKNAGLYSTWCKRQDEEKYIIVFEYLGHSIEAQDLEEGVEQVGLDMVHALNKLHKHHHYAHGDIKMEQFVMDDQRNVHIVDYGLSVSIDDILAGTYQPPPWDLNGAVFCTEKTDAAEDQRYNEINFLFSRDTLSLGVALSGVSGLWSHQRDVKEGSHQKIESKNTVLLRDYASFEWIISLMVSSNPHRRPDLELVKIAFLVDMHEGRDENLVHELKKYECITDVPNQAKLISNFLKEVERNQEAELPPEFRNIFEIQHRRANELSILRKALHGAIFNRASQLSWLWRRRLLQRYNGSMTGCSNFEELCRECARYDVFGLFDWPESLKSLRDALNEKKKELPITMKLLCVEEHQEITASMLANYGRNTTCNAYNTAMMSSYHADLSDENSLSP